MKYQFVVFLINNPNKNTASSKALIDCEEILATNNYVNLNVFLFKGVSKLLSTSVKFTFHILKLIFAIKNNSTIAVQYPVLGFNGYMKWLIKLLKRKGCKFVSIIHDVESLRQNDSSLYRREIDNLNCYDVVVTHSNQMTDWLKGNGLTSPCVEITIFDYLTSGNLPPVKQKSAPEYSIAFAGNLSKSRFLNDLPDLGSIKFNLYGPGVDFINSTSRDKFEWRGSFAPDEIVTKLDGDYGLLWDGDSITECSGPMGNYLQYNSPHKFSLYIAAGMPVIVPEKSAVASFVKEHGLGICVSTLTNLNDIISSISEAEYYNYRKNVLAIRQNVVNGNYLSSALALSEKILNAV